MAAMSKPQPVAAAAVAAMSSVTASGLAPAELKEQTAGDDEHADLRRARQKDTGDFAAHDLCHRRSARS